MKIVRVTATPLFVPVNVALPGAADREFSMGACVVEVETDNGIVGHGVTSITEEDVIATAINAVAGPAIIGDDPLAHERVWEKLYWEMMPRGQTGYAAYALAAIDVALWDIKGKALGQPVWRLLGGARERVPCYVTFGFHFFDRDELAAGAKALGKRGFSRLKMVVGHDGLRRRERLPLLSVIREDEARVRTVREAAGPDAELFVDGNCGLDPYHARRLANMIEPYGISFFEEPITQNDAAQMAQLRKQINIPLACGQNEGLAIRFRDFLVREAIDYAQPNVVLTGGFTQCAKIAGMAAAFNVPVTNGGAWQYHNMHLQAGVANGSMVEIHYLTEAFYRMFYDGVPTAENGWLTLPEAPGLGFTLRMSTVKEFAKKG